MGAAVVTGLEQQDLGILELEGVVIESSRSLGQKDTELSHEG